MSKSMSKGEPGFRPMALLRQISCRLRLLFVTLLSLSLGGCGFAALSNDLQQMEELVLIRGRVFAPAGGLQAGAHVVVLAFDRSGTGAELVGWQAQGLSTPFAFLLPAGPAYSIMAFEDRDHDGELDAGERTAAYRGLEPLRLPGRGYSEHLELRFAAADTPPPVPVKVDLGGGDRGALRLLAGTLADLDDEAFSARQGERAMWRPLDAVRETGVGVYFLEPYDPRKIPILFVNGIAGSAQDFRYFYDRLDRTRFQPWIFLYQSGYRIGANGSVLSALIDELHDRHGFEKLVVTAHSMGGLVARAFLIEQLAHAADYLDLFVTFSTPWGGMASAKQGVKRAPAAVPAWIDLQPGGEFLQQLSARPLKPAVPHHLFFGFKHGVVPIDTSNDGTVSVGSQLAAWAQADAARTYGDDVSHEGILQSAEVFAQYQELLAGDPSVVPNRANGRKP